MKNPLYFFVAIITCLTLSTILSGITLSFLEKERKPERVITSMEEKYLNIHPNEYSPLSLNDIHIPEIIPISTFGLKIYNGSSWKDSENEEDNPFDYTKPTVIYTHGMGTGSGIDNPNLWFSKGYNVCHFLWGPFSDDMPTNGQDKVWSTGKYLGQDKNILSFKDTLWSSGSSKTYSTDVPDHSITEIYAAYYFDLLMREDYTGSEIRFYGHSLGAQLNLALTNYLIYCLENGIIPISVLPDKVTLLDPYIADFDSNLICSWNGENMLGGSAKKALDTSIKAKQLGIAIEEIRTSEWVALAAYVNGGEFYEGFKSNIMYSHVDTNFLFNELPMTSAIERMHVIAEFWYADMMSADILFESNSSSYAMSPFSSKEYVYARMGNSYEINFSETASDLSDDSVTSDISKAKVGGFIYKDSNNNGIFDERLKNQLLGVRISLLDENNNELVSMATNLNGYFSFDLEIGKTYKLLVNEESGYRLGNLSSENFQIFDAKELLIINIPMLKDPA
ncbi:MAG: SdrD B-like domain-containing protein [Clostridia bacterium]|jgi:hypothetical protein|nr:SdrD B-like domain-containing protein [Clostridia bacterium]